MYNWSKQSSSGATPSPLNIADLQLWCKYWGKLRDEVNTAADSDGTFDKNVDLN